MKRISNQKGFSAVEGILIIVVVAVIGFVGWYVSHGKKPAATSKQSASSSATTASSSKTYTDPGGNYSFAYSDSIWNLQQNGVHPGPDTTALDSTDPWLIPKASYDGIQIEILGYQATGDLEADLSSALGDATKTSHSPENLTINGYKAIYKQISSSDYTDDIYILTNDKNSLFFSFREKQTSMINGNSSTSDGSKLTPDYIAIVKSVKFLK